MTNTLKKVLDPDLLGTAASIICLIHCLLMPWVLMISGAWLSQYVTHPYFHHIMLIAAIAIGLPIFIKSYLKYNSKTILILGCMGLSITTYGTFKYDPCLNKSIGTITESESTCETTCSSCPIEASINTSSTNEILNAPTPLLAEKNTIETKISSFVVPSGVLLILIAHMLNFRHRHSCKKKCCPSKA